MAALIAGLSTASSSSSPSVRSAQIKPPRSSDDDTLHEYFQKFEKAMRHNKIDQREWGHLLPVYLTGKAQASFTQVEEDTLDDYVTVKERMLESLGDTPASADRRWWTLSRRSGEEIGAFYLRVHSTGMRRLYGLKTREEICEKVILSRFLSTLPPNCYNSVVAKQPKTSLQASRFVQEFEESCIFSRRNQTWRSGTGQHPQSSGGRGSQETSFKREQFNGGSVVDNSSVA